MSPEQTAAIINATNKGWRVVAVAVPTRALRVIVESTDLKFRVEQLDPGQGPAKGTFKWRPISTHAGDFAFESFPYAMEALVMAQTKLKEKIKLAKHEAQMAQIRAQNPTGVLHS